jgi:hypothetical protein
MSRRSASFVPLLLVLGGCALVLGYGDEVELDRDAGVFDASSEASPVEASLPPDTRPFCEARSPKPTLCASFDGPSLLSEWTESETSNNVRLDRDTSSYVSPSASLRVSLARVDNGRVSGAVGASFDAWANKAFSVTIGFDIQIEAAAPADASAVIATPIAFSVPGRASYLAQLVGRPLADGSTIGLSLVEVTTSPDEARPHASSASLQIGKWTHIDLTMALAGANNSARLALDGAVGYEGPLELLASGTPFTRFGLAAADPAATSWAYRVDNVTLDFR